MAEPAGRVVSRVSVRVLPNVAAFGPSLKKYLERIERTEKVTIRVDFDVDQDRLARAIPKRTPPIKAPVDADTSDVDRELDVLQRRMQSLFNRIVLDADPRKVLAEFDRIEARARELDPTIEVDASTTAALDQARAAVAEIERREANIKIDGDATAARLAGQRAVSEINGRKATIKIDADRSSLSIVTGLASGFGSIFSTGAKLPSVLGAVSGAFDGVFSAGTSAFGAVSGFASSTLKLGPAASGAAGAAAAVVGVVGELGAGIAQFGVQVAQTSVVVGALTFAAGALGSAISSLPAIAFGGAAAVGTLAIAFSNFGDAVGRPDTPAGIKKQQEALAKLPPAARDTANAINGVLLPAFDTFRSAIQQSFFTGLAQVIKNVAAALPRLTAGFQGVATSVSGFLQQLAGVFTSTDGVRQLNVVLDNTKVLIDTMAPGVTSLVRSMLGAAQVTGVFRTIGEIVGGVSQRFGDLFARFSAGGESSLMAQSLTQLRNVVFGVTDVVGTLILKATEFFTAAGPGVTSALGHIQSAIGKVDFKGLGESFGRFADLVGEWIDRVPASFWTNLKTAFDNLTTSLRNMGNNPDVKALFSFLLDAIPATVTFVGDLVTKFSGFVSVVAGQGRVAMNFFDQLKIAVLTTQGTVISGMLTMAQGVRGFLNVMPGLPQSFKDAADGAIRNLQGLKTGVDTEITRTKGIIDARKPAIAASGQQLGGGLVTGVDQGAAPLTPQVQQKLQQAMTMLQSQDPAIRQRGLTLGTALLGGAVQGVQPLPEQMRQPLQQAMQMIQSQDPAMRDRGVKLMTELTAGVDTGGQSIGPSVDKTAGGAPTAVDTHQPAMRDAGANLGKAVPDGAGPEIGKLPETIRPPVTDGQRAVTDQVPAFQEAGKNLALGVARGIESGQSEVINAVTRLVTAAVNAAKTGLQIRSPSRVAEREIGVQFGAGTAVGIDRSTRIVVQASSTMAEQITAAASVGMRSAGVSAGEQFAQGLQAGITAAPPVVADPVVAAARLSTVGASAPAPAAGAAEGSSGSGGMLTPADAELLANAIASKGFRAEFGPNGAVHLARQANAGNAQLGRR